MMTHQFISAEQIEEAKMSVTRMASEICSRTVARIGESGVSLGRVVRPSNQITDIKLKSRLIVWQFRQKNRTLSHSTHTKNVAAVRFHINDTVIRPNQGVLIFCDQAGSVKVWDLPENTCSYYYELTPVGHIPMRSVTLADDGSCLVAGDNKGQRCVWKSFEESSGLPRFQAVTTFIAHNLARWLPLCMPMILTSKLKSLVTCSADLTCKVWSIGPSLESRFKKVLTGTTIRAWGCYAYNYTFSIVDLRLGDFVTTRARIWEMVSRETIRDSLVWHGPL
ncbi:hypothetical protein CYLTODRAFT_432443 [Cylindrobasidium torrendii FP15055 ss-10]|uniref:WD40 repeat-like protein n=1 Tax=Cylindrobasidium torrendii FP15055 ss-10 TaxID=1314674 RepID=A0A0D7B336_9AGAR|nr:hypothetical protein CYLTODRAFT_432443 [Cylindrobasidium torrendii FP15055 ss-10]